MSVLDLGLGLAVALACGLLAWGLVCRVSAWIGDRRVRGRGPVSTLWGRFESEARRRWPRLTTSDWRLAANTVTGLAGRIHERYGDTREAVSRQLHLLMFRVREKAPRFPEEPRPGLVGPARRGREDAIAPVGLRASEKAQADPIPQAGAPAGGTDGIALATAAGLSLAPGRAFGLATESLAPGVVQIQLRGALGAPSHHGLAETFATLIRGGTVRLVLDCSDLEAISSAGAAACVVAASHAQARGGNIVLLRPSAPVRELLGVLGLDTIIPYAEDLAAAFACLPVPPLPQLASGGPGFP